MAIVTLFSQILLLLARSIFNLKDELIELTEEESGKEYLRQRLSSEIFFKELKQHLKINSYISTNENAIWIQIWTALITILLLK